LSIKFAFCWFQTDPLPDSYIDLNPPGFNLSWAQGISGNHQVGWGATTNIPHALLWSGTAASAIDLNPNGFFWSEGIGIDGKQQIGYGARVAGGKTHALLWKATAASAIDLTPAGFTDSWGYSTNGSQQVGAGKTGNNSVHALLWNETAASVVDLNPAGFIQSWAEATNGTDQVGYGEIHSDSSEHALVWSGTAERFIDLQTFLPKFYTQSKAFGIAANGNVVGTAYNSNTYQWNAIEWIPVPAMSQPANRSEKN
jgi:hypothetical protein